MSSTSSIAGRRQDGASTQAAAAASAVLFSQTTFSYGIVDFIAGLRYDMYSIDGTGSISGVKSDRFAGVVPSRSIAT